MLYICHGNSKGVAVYYLDTYQEEYKNETVSAEGDFKGALEGFSGE